MAERLGPILFAAGMAGAVLAGCDPVPPTSGGAVEKPANAHTPNVAPAVAIAQMGINKQSVVIIRADGSGQFFSDSPEQQPLIPSDQDTPVAVTATPDGQGIHVLTKSGRDRRFGDAPNVGDLSSLHLNQPVVDADVTPSGKGVSATAGDGGYFALGDAHFLGSLGDQHQTGIVGQMLVDGGYGIIRKDGKIFPFGTFPQQVVASNNLPLEVAVPHLNAPIVRGVRVAGGAVLVASDCGAFVMGDLKSDVHAQMDAQQQHISPQFYGSGVQRGKSDCVDIAPFVASDGTTTGYWELTKSGEVLGFGAAKDLDANSGGNNGPLPTTPTTPTSVGNASLNAPEIAIANVACGVPASLWFDRTRGNIDNYNVAITDSRFPGQESDLAVTVRPNTTPDGTPDRSNIDIGTLLSATPDQGTGTIHVSIKTPDGLYGKEVDLLNTANPALDPGHCPRGQDLDMTIGKFTLDRIG